MGRDAQKRSRHTRRKANWMYNDWRRQQRRELIGRILFWMVVTLTIAAPAFGCGWFAAQCWKP